MTNNKQKGCGKEIDMITGQGVIMRTVKCGVPQKNHIDYIGYIEYCDDCKEKRI